ncbi:MAG: tetratricopeptide repeat protein [Xanthobacteraceae bacterium]
MVRNVIFLAAAATVTAHILVHPAIAFQSRNAVCAVMKKSGDRGLSNGCAGLIQLVQEEDYETLIYPAFKLCEETGDKSPLERRTQQCAIPIDWARAHNEYSILTQALTDRCWVHILLNEAEPAKPDCAAALAAEQAYERKGGNAADYAHAVYAANAALQSLLEDFKGALDDENTAVDYITSPAPGYAYIFSNRGLTYTYLKQFDDALDDFNQAIRLDSKYMPAYLNRGLEYERRGDPQHAKEDFSTAVALPAEDYDFGHEKHDKAAAHLKALTGK